MCGIAGLLTSAAIDPSLVSAMTVPITHRGPDDCGTWVDAEAGIGLGHRRLSIVDLSLSGHQPMQSASGNLVLAFNGEIYNHGELRNALARDHQVAWRGHSDTETLIECIAAWGLDRTLEQAVGMFAIALWDRHHRRLSLVRDRFGEKPLYYGWVGRDFAFGSELKALRVHPGFANAIDREALGVYASRAYVPAPLSIYRGIFKLEPGCILEIDRAAVGQPLTGAPVEGETGPVRLRRYWRYRDVVMRGLQDPFGSEEEALESLDAALSAAIRGQSVADVPVGAFLSGGIDSSSVVALYQRHSSSAVRTFTIGFDDPAFDEAGPAKAIAQHFGTTHQELYVTAEHAQTVIPQLAQLYDEPFADSSQIPTYLVSDFARGQVTVALTGDGGDELFGGYNRYFGTARLWSHMGRLPAPVRAVVGKSLSRLPPIAWDGVGALLPGPLRPPHFGTKVRKALTTMGRAGSIDDVFMSFLDEWSGERSPVLGAHGKPAAAGFDLAVGSGAPDLVRMMYCDSVSYLPDDILCKVDRAAMAVSLETRVPFLDHRVAAVAARIPIEMKINRGQGKRILRQLLYREAPAALFERPKAGFGMPLGRWLRGPLRPWAESLLDERRLREGGFFDPRIVRKRWAEHLAGKRDAGPTIWAILAFEQWRMAQ